MSFLRRSVAVALALVFVMGVSGCTEVGSLVAKAQIDLGLARLATTLDELAGISTESTATITGDYDYTVSVHSTATKLTEQQLVAVAIAVDDELGAGVFEGRQVEYELTIPEGTLYQVWEVGLLSNDQLITEVGYLYDLADAYGAPLGVAFQEGNLDTYSRFIHDLNVPAEPDWEALRAVPDVGTADHSWGLAGIGGSGDVPPKQVTDLVSELYRVVPFVNLSQTTSETFLVVDWFSPRLQVALISSSYDDLTIPAASPAWAQAVRVAGLLESAQLPDRNFSYYGNGGMQGTATVHFGECDDDVFLSEGDVPLAEALTASGVTGVVAGFCDPL